MSSAASVLFEKHEAALLAASTACRVRGYFTLFPETPDRHRGGAAAKEAGLAAFQAQLGRSFELDQPGTIDRCGGEVSPYTLEPLGIDYPRADADSLFAAARAAMPAWAAAAPRERLGVCMEIVDRLYDRIFESAPAVMHTAGTERTDELRRQRHQCPRSRRRSAGLRPCGHARCATRGALGASLRFHHPPLAQALPARAARRGSVLRVRDVSHVERVSRHAGEPRDG